MISKFPICYETHGDSINPCIILITGIGGQLIQWSEVFIQELVNKNLYVVTFDNRDSGHSHYYEELGTPDLTEAMKAKQAGKVFNPPYTFNDMACDVILLMDRLSVQTAHILGSSMGGMIAQTLAINHPERILSLILIATSSGDRHLSPPTQEVQAIMASSFSVDKPEKSLLINKKTELFRIYDPFFFNEKKTRDLSEKLYNRTNSPDGFKRQLFAFMCANPRGEMLRNIRIKSLIIHGTHDPAFPLDHGKYLHDVLAESQLAVIEKMGHLISEELCLEITTIISDFTNSQTMKLQR